MDELDRRLLALLRQDARESAAALAKKLKVSRGTIQNRIARLLARGDIQGFTTGTAAVNGLLRAERLGTGTGRVYTFTYQGSDRAGNSATCRTSVAVPHDQGQ